MLVITSRTKARHFQGPYGFPRLNPDWPLRDGLVNFFDLSLGPERAIDLTGHWYSVADNSSGDLSQTATEYGPATRFSGDGTNDRIELSNGLVGNRYAHFAGLAPGGGGLSIAFLAGSDNTDNTARRIYDRSNNTNVRQGHGLWAFNDSGTLRWAMNDGTSERNEDVNATGTWATGAWTHFGVISVTNWNTGVGEIYKDGEGLNATWPATSSASMSSTLTKISIGNWNHSTDRMWAGWIKYVAFWDRPLSAPEARYLFEPATRWDYRAVLRRKYFMRTASGRVMSKLVAGGGLAGDGGLAGQGGGLAG